jgi:hypothetical protein
MAGEIFFNPHQRLNAISLHLRLVFLRAFVRVQFGPPSVSIRGRIYADFNCQR